MGVFNTIEHYDGSSWTLISEGPFDGTEPFYQDIWGTSATNIYAAARCSMAPGPYGGCLDGFVYQYDGFTWTKIYQLAEAWLYGIWGISDTNVYAVGDNGTIVHYNGTTWTVMNSGTEATLRGIWFDSPEDVFVVGDSGTILHYDGIDWSPMTSGTTVSLRGIWGISDTNVYAVGDNGTILHYNGISWTQMNIGNDSLCYAIWGYSETEIFASCTGAVLRYDGDYDSDGFSDYLDNCPYITNPGQEDTYPLGGNGCGDVCECEGNFDDDQDQDGSDAATFKTDFGRSMFLNPCTNSLSCNGDFDCDHDVDGTDAAVFKEDFGRSQFNNPCSSCSTDPWCMYEGDPFINNYSDSGCLGASSQSGSDQEGECANEDRVTAEVVGDSIMVTNTVYFNCCSGIEVELTADGNYLHLLTMENPPGTCFCICCFGVETEIAGLASGEYTVEMCWSDWGSGYDCETETVVVP